jgi:hypothetical protein
MTNSRYSPLVVLALALAAGPAAAAQEPAATQPAPGVGVSTGWVDFGVRATDVSGDADRFERYRDVGSGGFLDRLLWGRATSSRILRVSAANAGRRDQRFEGLFEHTGRFRATFLWDCCTPRPRWTSAAASQRQGGAARCRGARHSA